MNRAQHLFPTRHHDTKQNKTVKHTSIGESESLLIPLQPSFTTESCCDLLLTWCRSGPKQWGCVQTTPGSIFMLYCLPRFPTNLKSGKIFISTRMGSSKCLIPKLLENSVDSSCCLLLVLSVIDKWP